MVKFVTTNSDTAHVCLGSNNIAAQGSFLGWQPRQESHKSEVSETDSLRNVGFYECRDAVVCPRKRQLSFVAVKVSRYII
jgi:hypothetical protein